MLTQFSGEGSTLAELGDFPSDVYPVGRLDKDSEGLLLLTNDKALNHFLLNPRYGHHRTYYVQVEGLIGLEALQQLQKGVVINVEGRDYKTKSARAMLMADIPDLPPATRRFGTGRTCQIVGSPLVSLRVKTVRYVR